MKEISIFKINDDDDIFPIKLDRTQKTEEQLQCDHICHTVRPISARYIMNSFSCRKE